MISEIELRAPHTLDWWGQATTELHAHTHTCAIQIGRLQLKQTYVLGNPHLLFSPWNMSALQLLPCLLNSMILEFSLPSLHTETLKWWQWTAAYWFHVWDWLDIAKLIFSALRMQTRFHFPDCFWMAARDVLASKVVSKWRRVKSVKWFPIVIFSFAMNTENPKNT